MTHDVQAARDLFDMAEHGSNFWQVAVHFHNVSIDGLAVALHDVSEHIRLARLCLADPDAAADEMHHHVPAVSVGVWAARESDAQIEQAHARADKFVVRYLDNTAPPSR